jgi:hypothetical protein
MDECTTVKIEYKGDGVQTVFIVPFTYMNWDDIKVYLYDETDKAWEQTNSFVRQTNASAVEFFTAPPAPTDADYNVRIVRNTELQLSAGQTLKEYFSAATFQVGSSIRAEDLNNNFDQLRLAIQEGRCAIQYGLEVLDENTWNTDEAYTYDDQVNQRWVEADDTKLATSDAIRARHDAYVQSNVPPNVVYEQSGKTWQNTDDCWSSYWQNSVDPDGNDSKTWVAYVNTGPRGQQGPQGPPGQSIVGPPGPEGPVGPNGGTFPDAPSDGKTYGRKDATWAEVTGGGGGQSPLTFIKPLVNNNNIVSIDLLTIPNA